MNNLNKESKHRINSTKRREYITDAPPLLPQDNMLQLCHVRLVFVCVIDKDIPRLPYYFTNKIESSKLYNCALYMHHLLEKKSSSGHAT